MKNQSKLARENRNVYRNLNENDVFKLNKSILSACKPKQRNKPTRTSSINAFGVRKNHANNILSKILNKNTNATEPSVIESSTFSKFQVKDQSN